MQENLRQAFVSGVERISAWADLLDGINVFPVADGDTGRNLVITLSPLVRLGDDPDGTVHSLLMSARGNSGNIAARFFSGFLTAGDPESLPGAAEEGRDAAWRAVADPQAGTILSLLDALVEALGEIKCGDGYDARRAAAITDRLEMAVKSTSAGLPALKEAGVVDSGALGMFIYLECFFHKLAGISDGFRPLAAVFGDMLTVSKSFAGPGNEDGFCVDLVVKSDKNPDRAISELAGHDESLVVIPDDKGHLKIHLHTDDPEETKRRVESLGKIVEWSDDDIGVQVKTFKQAGNQAAIRIMTDAAGSVTREDAKNLGITLLDSYINMGGISIPETRMDPAKLYGAMRRGVKVSTSQASNFERHQHYQSVLDRHGRVLYICVGSVFTGNHAIATDWKQANDTDGRMTVIDSAAASGRLGLVAMAAARYARQTGDPESVVTFAKKASEICGEWVFLDTLKYLAAGGRLSKTSAFFGNMLHMKPIISPTAEGAKKVGVVRNRKDQLRFAAQKLDQILGKDSKALLMLEYTDNIDRIAGEVLPILEKSYPEAEILLRPVSLTSGAHMGPGTWAVAALPCDCPR